MAYTVEQLASEGFRRYIEEEGGEWWDFEYAVDRARDMFAWCLHHSLDLNTAASELAGVLYMEE